MVFQRLESAHEIRTAEKPVTSQHVFNDTISERPQSHARDRVENRRLETQTQRSNIERRDPKAVDCAAGCPFKDVNLARAEISHGRASDAFTKADARLLKNFNPNNGPMSESQMTALDHLRKHAMDAGPDGKPLWTSFAPEDPSARLQFKSLIFGDNADYQSAVNLMNTSDSQYSRQANSEFVRDYGETLPNAPPQSFDTSYTTSTVDFSAPIYPHSSS